MGSHPHGQPVSEACGAAARTRRLVRPTEPYAPKQGPGAPAISVSICGKHDASTIGGIRSAGASNVGVRGSWRMRRLPGLIFADLFRGPEELKGWTWPYLNGMLRSRSSAATPSEKRFDRRWQWRAGHSVWHKSQAPSYDPTGAPEAQLRRLQARNKAPPMSSCLRIAVIGEGRALDHREADLA
jgi:hypothetical protein